jgi:hypothetical protein
MINVSLQEFVSNVTEKGQVCYGDVRRLQRDYLAGGITNDQELEVLISLNGSLVRADKAWTQWFVSSVSDFATNQQASDHLHEVAKGVRHRLLAASQTSLARRIARRVQRELLRQLGIPSEASGHRHIQAKSKHEVRPAPQAANTASDVADCSRPGTKARRSRTRERAAPSRSHRRVRRATGPRTTPGHSTAHALPLPGYFPAFQRSPLINFQSSTGAILLGPCR